MENIKKTLWAAAAAWAVILTMLDACPKMGIAESSTYDVSRKGISCASGKSKLPGNCTNDATPRSQRDTHKRLRTLVMAVTNIISARGTPAELPLEVTITPFRPSVVAQ
eukprot:12362942-Karenia_brevis.AAC.1